MKSVLLGTVGVVVGFVAGMVCMIAVHLVSFLIWPMPEGIDMFSQEPENMERLSEWMVSLPLTAWLFAVLAHGIGSFSGAIVATLISGRRSIVPAVVSGILFTLAGVANLMKMDDHPDHPDWFAYVDTPIYLVFALIAWALLRKAPEPQAA